MRVKLLSVALLYGALALDCRKPQDPSDVIGYEDAGIVIVDSACSFLQGMTHNQTVIAICATVEEIAFIASIIAPLLAREAIEGGSANVDCEPLPTVDLCATPEQMGTAIQALYEKRRARLMLEGGIQ